MAKKKNGRPKGEPYTRKTVIVPDQILDELRKLAEKNGTKLHAEMIAALRDRAGLGESRG